MRSSRLFVIFLFVSLCTATFYSQQSDRELYLQNYLKGDFEKALLVARQAARKNDSDWHAHYHVGLSLLRLGREGDAAKALRKAVALNDKESNVHAALAYAYLLRNDKRATEAARAALKLDKNSAEANYVLSAMSLGNQSYNVAYEHSKAAIRLSPKMSPAYLVKSQSLVSSFVKQRGTVLRPEHKQSGILEEAASDLEEFLKLEPNHKNASYYRSYIDSLKFFAEYYSRAENKIPDTDAAAEATSNRTPLKILYKQKASYTDEARRAGVSGTITMLVGFSADRTIKHILVIKPLGFGLDQEAEAVAAARAMKFEPETENGIPVSTVRPVTFSFRIG
jgi:TonB family protein